MENLIKDKKVLILGFGREGKATYNFLMTISCYKELAIADMNDISFENMTVDESKIKVFTGKDYFDSIKNYDIVFKSPGVVIPKNINVSGKIVTSEMEIFLQKYGKQIIGITGTKGKSTVTSLIYHVLKECKKPCMLAGNIGVPVFNIIDDIKDDTNVVIELSCHQLENCKYSPCVAVLLNIYEDHLDHYDNFEKYYEAKKNIYKHQNENDILYYGQNIVPENCKSKKIKVKGFELPFKNFKDVGINILGEHNKYNFSMAYMVLKKYGISDSDFIKAINSFKMLSHRIEYIGNKNDIDFYDDSISTTVESCICAIDCINNISTVLVGGLDRGINYDKLVDFLKEKKLDNVICMYDSGKRIYDDIKNKKLNVNVSLTKNLDEAIDCALKKTKKGGACLLSPASASYGYFKNFEERGNHFKERVFGKYD